MENRWTNKEKELAELLKQIGVIELYHWYKDTYWYTESDTGKLPRKSFPSLNHDERIDINEIVVGDDMIQGCIKSDYIIAECPTIDAVEVVYGRWEKEPPYTSLGGEYKKALICSECHSFFVSDGNKPWQLHNYCPNCGAKMDGERIEE